MPKSLHRMLAEHSKCEGISIACIFFLKMTQPTLNKWQAFYMIACHANRSYQLKPVASVPFIQNIFHHPMILLIYLNPPAAGGVGNIP